MLRLFESGALGASDLRFIESKLRCGIWTRKIGSEEMQWSRGMYELLGIEPGNQKPTFTLMASVQHPDDRLTFASANANLEKGEPFERKYRVIRTDGTQRTLLHRGEVIVDQTGIPDHAIAVVVDVTEIQTLTDELQRQTRQITAATEHSELVISIVRPDGFVTSVLGTSRELELKRRYGFSWIDIIHPDDKDASIAAFDVAKKNQCKIEREHRIIGSDGQYNWRRAIWTPNFDASGKLREFVSISYNIDRERIFPQSENGAGTTGAQIRAARAVVNWSVKDLADRSNVPISFVRRVEDNDGPAPTGTELQLIYQALTHAGVEFIFPRTGKPGVRPI